MDAEFGSATSRSLDCELGGQEEARPNKVTGFEKILEDKRRKKLGLPLLKDEFRGSHTEGQNNFTGHEESLEQNKSGGVSSHKCYSIEEAKKLGIF